MEKSANSEVTITKIPIKKENLNDDIKEFAETAMSELLGWYGYENTRDELKVSRSCRSHSGSNSSGLESPKSTDGCGWCGKSIDENTGLTSASAAFCSELCFSQSRRANFKKNKTCDWCRHVRHTVSYVDFQDGASQLQFCSDKCLNQYKMHIFCRETRAHLELHPHLHIENTTGTLITPDLWMKNCKSPELRTPSPQSPKPFEKPPQTSPLPLISVTHPSKLMESPDSKRNRLKALKKMKKRLPATVTCNSFDKSPPSDLPQDLRVRHTPTDLDTPNSKDPIKEKPDTLFKPIVPPMETRIPTPPPMQPSSIFQENPPDAAGLKKLFENILPPPTIVVPYPIFLPLPLPIPIPIPIPMKKEEVAKEKKDSFVQTDTVVEEKGNNVTNGCPEDETNSTDIDVVTVEEKKSETKKSGRLLRKRKRTCEPRGVALKTRRILSHLSY